MARVMVKKRISKCYEYLKNMGIDCFVVPTSDFHDSEYVSDYFKGRTFLTGFTGSAGTLVLTQEEAALWTDGRYFIQAALELEGSGITLMKMDQPGVPKIEDYLSEKLPENGVLGFDGRVITYKQGCEWKNKLAPKNIKIKSDYDLIDEIWEERPSLPKEPLFILEEKYCGKSYKNKLNDLLNEMERKNATVFVESAVDNIAWFLNLRGHDVESNPVFLSFLLVQNKQATVYLDQSKINAEVRTYLDQNEINTKDYFAIFEDLSEINKEAVWLDSNAANYALYSAVKDTNMRVDIRSPFTLWKAMKNEIEIQNLRNVHIKDGVAVTKFAYWLKNNVGKEKISELSAQQYLYELRKKLDLFIEPSFDTICAYKEHAAMMHYSSSEETDVEVKAEGMLLVDSGGQYFDGTTDITRTFVLGPISQEEKRAYTLVVKSMINLAMQKFLYGCIGLNLDIIARSVIWNEYIDYQCGTGHGVGFLLNIHEGPHNLRWKMNVDRRETQRFEEGMVVTDEPGIYEAGRFGIRTENELVVRKTKANAYGQFMEFEVITYAPIDLDGIDAELLTKEEKEYLNAYHKAVFEKLSPFLVPDEASWLRHYTREI